MKTLNYLAVLCGMGLSLALPAAAQTGNTTNGTGTLVNVTTGSDNSADGYYALYSTTTGLYNSAAGAFALYFNLSGQSNTAIGYVAMESNSSGSGNTALGYAALYRGTNGSDNTGVGAFTLYNNATGSGNTANGAYALYSNIKGSYNTANGYQALYHTTGSTNTAIGYEAGANLTNGGLNIYLANKGTGENFSGSESATIRIGDYIVHSNIYAAGIYGQTLAGGLDVYADQYGQLGVVNSSRRFKRNIQGMGDESGVLLSLRPVAFQYTTP